MSFSRYDVMITPRKLTPEQRANWPRKDGSERECVLVYDLQLGTEIPAEGAVVSVTTRDHQVTYSKLERDGDIDVSLPGKPKRSRATRATTESNEG